MVYTLHFGTYSGDAGDSFKQHNGQKFSKRDKDNDEAANSNCAQTKTGAWWYKGCHSSNLNGWNFGTADQTPYAKGIVWHAVTTHYYSLKSVEMSIRPMNYPQ